MKLRNLVAPRTLSISPETPIEEITRTMTEFSADCLAVLQDNRVVGIVTRRDLQEGSTENPWRCAQDVMSKPVILVAAGEEVEEAVRVMLAHRVRHLVVHERGRLAGLISLEDLVRREPCRCVLEAFKYLSEHNRRVDGAVSLPMYFG